MDSKRFLFVPSHGADGFVTVSHGDSGTEAQRIGRAGEGPGEYRYIRWVVPHESGLHVFDPVALRRTLLDADYRVVHTSPLPVRLAGTAAVLGDSSYVVNGSISTSARIGYALHHFSPSGELMRSFDESPLGHGVPGAEISSYRSLRVGPDGLLWSAHRTRYQIDTWDVGQGELLHSHMRAADWFPPHLEWGSNDPRRSPRPEIIDMEIDPQGRLWMLISVASDQWSEAFVNLVEGSHPELDGHRLDDWTMAYDTRIEVIDPTEGCVIAHRIVDEYLPFFVGPGWAVSFPDYPTPDLQMQLWRLALSSQQPLEMGGSGCA